MESRVIPPLSPPPPPQNNNGLTALLAVRGLGDELVGGSHVLANIDGSGVIVIEASRHVVLIIGPHDLARSHPLRHPPTASAKLLPSPQVLHCNLDCLKGSRFIVNGYLDKKVVDRAGRVCL